MNVKLDVSQPYSKCQRCKNYKNLEHFTHDKVKNAPFDWCDSCLRSTKRKTRIGKICCKCRKIKGFDYFYDQKNTASGKGAFCKSCTAKYNNSKKVKNKLKVD